MSTKARIHRSSKRVFDCFLASQDKTLQATLRGTLYQDFQPVVGDYVTLEDEGKETLICQIEPRKNEVFRNLPRTQEKKVIAANVDLLIIVVSAERPAYKRGLVDRYLVRAFQWEIPTIVVFNKMDLYQKDFDIQFEAQRLAEIEASCFEVSATQNSYEPKYLCLGINELKEEIKGKTVIMLGHSGVGNSRLISSLTDNKIQLLSKDLGKSGKGAHTTTWAEIIHAKDFDLIDSPGVRSMSLEDIKEVDLIDYFPDIKYWSSKCQFNNCQHQESSKGCFFNTLANEKGELLLSRLNSYQQILKEITKIPDWEK